MLDILTAVQHCRLVRHKINFKTEWNASYKCCNHILYIFFLLNRLFVRISVIKIAIGNNYVLHIQSGEVEYSRQTSYTTPLTKSSALKDIVDNIARETKGLLYLKGN